MTDIQKALRKITDPHELSEKRVQRLCIDLYRSVGVWVVEFSQPFRNTQTPGIPDLLCYYRDEEDMVAKWWFETKTFKKKPSPVQKEFHTMLRDMGEDVYFGGLNKAIELLIYYDVARFESVEGHW